MTVLVDLSHVIRAGTQTYPGLPDPEVGDYVSFRESRERYGGGTEFLIGRLWMVTLPPAPARGSGRAPPGRRR